MSEEEIVSKFESASFEDEMAAMGRARERGLLFTGKDAVHDAIVAAKRIRTEKRRKAKVGISIDRPVLEGFKAKAEKLGIPYQTLLNSVLKRYVDGKLDIAVA